VDYTNDEEHMMIFENN